MKIKLAKEQTESNLNYIFMDWYELTAAYKMLISGEYKPKKKVLKYHVGDLDGVWFSDTTFYSVKAPVMVDRLNNGYEFDLGVDPERLPTITYERPRATYTDDPEGEYSHDLFESGETEYFLTKPRKKSVGGLRLKIQMNASCGVNQEVVAEYTQWVGHVIQHLQSRGYDLEIEVFAESTGTYHEPYTARDLHIIRLSKFGERVMPHDWSALFSPGGFRHLVFLSYMWPGEHSRLNPDMGLGVPGGSAYDIIWEPDSRTIKITTNAHNNSFPLEEMTKKFESWKE